FSAFFRYVFLFSCAAGTYLAFGSKELEKQNRMEFSLLIVCVTFGMCLMAISTHLLMLYIGIETVSILSFVMAGFKSEDLRASEASFKYFIFGAFASALMLYGFSLIYGLTGSLQYGEIAQYVQANLGNMPYLLPLSLILVYSGLAYKISAFPMHFWTPDVYEGSPTPVASFFSVGPKAAGFAAILRFFLDILSYDAASGSWKAIGGEQLVSVVAIISAITMTVGNLSAIGQNSVKRMLAYSSIAHVGYMLMGILTLDTFGLGAILFYIIAYCAMNFGAFWVVSIVADLKGSDRLDAFRGLGWSMPVLGVTMVIFLASLAGIPMFSGFIGKMLIFGAIVKTPGLLWLAVLGVLNSVVSLYYYAKILRELWLEGREPGNPSELSIYHGVALVGLAIPTVVLGLWFAPVIHFVERSIATIL
ncbi:MAG: NADH-quinone oxidoreductase subunit N, partial [Bdellovibrionales bacterium]|nr:NADH-quinone oxidoreductase subunit N [Bdellovibrionales bacterium]